MDILSNFGQENITDCLQVNIDNNSENICIDGKEQFIRYTFADVTVDKDGETIPIETGLTVKDDLL